MYMCLTVSVEHSIDVIIIIYIRLYSSFLLVCCFECACHWLVDPWLLSLGVCPYVSFIYLERNCSCSHECSKEGSDLVMFGI